MKGQRGFTLIEISVVLGITMLLLGLITINLGRSQQSASANSTEQMLLADLKQQQLKAMIGDTEGRADTDDYGVHFNEDNYVLFHGIYMDGEPTNFVIDLSSNFHFTSSGSDMIFEKISGELAPGSVTSIVLENTTNGSTKTISVNRFGVITEILE